MICCLFLVLCAFEQSGKGWPPTGKAHRGSPQWVGLQRFCDDCWGALVCWLQVSRVLDLSTVRITLPIISPKCMPSIPLLSPLTFQGLHFCSQHCFADCSLLSAFCIGCGRQGRLADCTDLTLLNHAFLLTDEHYTGKRVLWQQNGSTGKMNNWHSCLGKLSRSSTIGNNFSRICKVHKPSTVSLFYS